MSNLPLNKYFLDEVEKFTEQNLSKKEFFQNLLEIVNKNNLSTQFENLCFTGKFANGLARSIKNAHSNLQITNTEQIKKEFSDSLEKVKNILKEIVTYADQSFSDKTEFDFLTIDDTQLRNLLILIEDIDLIKRYLNYRKRTN
jgi:hypothetical protein